MTRSSRALRLGLLAVALCSPTVSGVASAEPTDPVIIGWWSYFDYSKVPTVTHPAHVVNAWGDRDTYYYEPSGGHGMQEDPAVLPTQQAWNAIVSYTLAQSSSVTLQAQFTRDESSDLNQWTEAYYGWAFALLYVPREKYCDPYHVHIGSVDDGVQAMANASILGYSNLGQANVKVPMVSQGSSQALLRPGINEVVLIHEDQAKVQRYVRDVYVTHSGAQIPLAPKNIIWGRVTDVASGNPIYQATVDVSGNGVTDTFQTGPLGFYFFAGLANGSYSLSGYAKGYKTAGATGTVTLGQAATEVNRQDLPLTLGCECPNGMGCGPSGGCLPNCIQSGELGQTCQGTGEVCVGGVCVKDPCDTILCPPNAVCLDGACVEVTCTNVCCQTGEVCSNGQCVPDHCGAGCPAGQACSGGSCVPACSVVSCVPGLACVDGKCLNQCVADPSKCGFGDAGLLGDGGIIPGGSGGAPGSGGTGAGGSGGRPFGPSRGSTAADDGGCGCGVIGGRAPLGLLAGLLGLSALALGRLLPRRALAARSSRRKRLFHADDRRR